jgi:methyltransferase (TIGR00027 family)
VHPSKPSSTARLIAQSILLAERSPSHRALITTDQLTLAQRLLDGPLASRWFRVALNSRTVRWCLWKAERVLLDGVIAHYLARKRWIELQARNAVATGCSQIVVLGAGYDSLAATLAEKCQQLTCFELDHPATQKTKRPFLPALQNLNLVPIDFSLNQPTQLLCKHPSFSAGRTTLVIAEGLFMYFPPSRLKALIADIAKLAHSRSQLLFSFMHRTPGKNVGFENESWLISHWLRQRQEPFQWSASRDECATMLSHAGLTAMRFADHQTLHEEILTPLGCGRLKLARGEHLCLAST